jgi:hypothetical protein
MVLYFFLFVHDKLASKTYQYLCDKFCVRVRQVSHDNSTPLIY